MNPFEPYSTMPRECGGLHRYILVITNENKKRGTTCSTTNVELGNPEIKAWYRANEEEVDETILYFCKNARDNKGLKNGESIVVDNDQIAVRVSRLGSNVFVITVDWLDDDDDETVDETDDETVSEDPSE